jgi:hypothetical protein
MISNSELLPPFHSAIGANPVAQTGSFSKENRA